MPKSTIKQVQDANGKTFDLDISKICDINGDMGESVSISDSLKNRVHQVHDIQYCDQNGEAIDSLKLLADMTSGKTKVIALDVEMEATHSGKNHNYTIYYEDSMEKDAESFVNPFRKPVLKNHNSYSGEPMGRVLQAYAGPSELTDERAAIHLKARITDQDAMLKFIDGRYRTVSIGGTMGTVTCNVCGKNILKDGKFKFCGHWRGETYKDEVCYWGVKDIEYHEVSTVNNPADDFAQIMKVTVVTDSNNKDNKEEDNMDGKDEKTTVSDGKVATAKDAICLMIDELLGNKISDSKEPPVTESTSEVIDEAITDESNVSDANTEVETLKTQLADAVEKLEKAEAEIITLKDSLEKQTKDLEDSNQEATAAKDKCIALATLNKELIADNVIRAEVLAGSLKEDATDSRKEELLAMSMKDLNAITIESTDATVQRQPAHVDNPTLPTDDANDSNSKTADTHKKTTDSIKTIDDFTNDVIKKLVK